MSPSNIGAFFDFDETLLDILNGKIDELTHLSSQQAGDEIKFKLQQVVPEYNPKT